MRVPILLESVGPCGSSWVRRRGLKRILIEGLDESVLVVQSSCGKVFSTSKNGTHVLPEDITGRRLKVKHISETPVTVDLVA